MNNKIASSKKRIPLPLAIGPVLIPAFVLTLLYFLLAGCSLAQDEQTYPPVQEGSVSLDGGTHTYKLLLPDGFEKPDNFMNLYPLVIGLHGSTTLTDHYYVVNEVKDAEPCVYFAPNNSNLSFGGDLKGVNNSAWIRETLHSIIKNPNYKIDRNRIYIIGFSMGAHGTTYMAQDLYTEYKYRTAAIVPADGGRFEYITSSEVRDHISSWFHQGAYSQESDYKNAKAYYPGTMETVRDGHIDYFNSWDPATVYSYDTTVYTLIQAKAEIFKLTIYEGMGHTSGPVFKDPAVISWLFSKSISDRNAD